MGHLGSTGQSAEKRAPLADADMITNKQNLEIYQIGNNIITMAKTIIPLLLALSKLMYQKVATGISQINQKRSTFRITNVPVCKVSRIDRATQTRATISPAFLHISTLMAMAN